MREVGVGALGAEELAVALGGGGTTRCAPPSRICIINVHGTFAREADSYELG